jgi:PhnB protein
MLKLNPYLTFPGTAAGAIELYKKVFKVEPTMVQKFKDAPPPEGGSPLSATGGERVLHASFQIGNDMLMISDAPEGQDSSVEMGGQMQVSVHPESKEEADRMFALLSDGSKIFMPMAMQFWGDYFGMCKDKFGIGWMINYHEDKK